MAFRLAKGVSWHSKKSQADVFSRFLRRRSLKASPASEPEVSCGPPGAFSKKWRECVNSCEDFTRRHVGILPSDEAKMLSTVKMESVEALVSAAVPDDIRLGRELNLPKGMSEQALLARIRELGEKNEVWRSYIGCGYYNCLPPPTIVRNVVENPGWTTQYTPYQAELSQGRLECLLNYQTLTADMTGLPLANASLLDESTAAAEALGMCYRVANMERRPADVPPRNTFVVDSRCHPQTLAVLHTRARGLGVELVITDRHAMTFDSTVAGVLLQYPDTDGIVQNHEAIITAAKSEGALVAMVTDLLALSLLKSPGEMGADIAVGSSQRLGVPLGYGGPHAAFFATRTEHRRVLPGRVVGVTKDARGEPAYRLALQTREQHIRRGKATSNICTAQALLANMSALYAVYHGPEGLRAIGERVHRSACLMAHALTQAGYQVQGCGNEGEGHYFFDTVGLSVGEGQMREVMRRAVEKKINLRYRSNGEILISLDETVTEGDLDDLLYVFGCQQNVATMLEDDSSTDSIMSTWSFLGTPLERNTPYLTHHVFNRYQSETELVRYMKRLENRDLSLAHSMTPLGSCTMKLNATSEMVPMTLNSFCDLHPLAPPEQAAGYRELVAELDEQLCEITGYDKICFQPNSGAQGEFTGLLTIMRYLHSRGETDRDVCIIPESAHGTNPASASMAGMQTETVRVNARGAIDRHDLDRALEKHKGRVAALMITYPSTNGFFEKDIREVCALVHEHGGQIYLDGANMNAQAGVCRPADYGSDVSHLNLHKTFCIPHGGGGPGMGPIGVKAHLIPHLPSHPALSPHGVDGPVGGATGDEWLGAVSSAPYGSASILPISWAYIKLLGGDLRRCTEAALLNANYMKVRLSTAYELVYGPKNGVCAHEFLLDCRPFIASAGIDATDVAKRLQDYGFHAPTVSFPVTNALMIEPTESEGKEELDRYCDALLSIREEIRDIADGRLPRDCNPLKMAPHTLSDLVSADWDRPYSRQTAVFPAPFVRPKSKFWPAVNRVDDRHGDMNFVGTRQD